MIRYYDEHGNRLNIRTELDDALDKLYDELDKLTPEERRACMAAKFAKLLPNTYIRAFNRTNRADRMKNNFYYMGNDSRGSAWMWYYYTRNRNGKFELKYDYYYK